MSVYFLAPPLGSEPAVEPPSPETVPTLALESLDGLRRIPLDGSTGWQALTDATDLDMPPMDVVTAAVPGVAGSMLLDVRAMERPVVVPIMAMAPNQSSVTHQVMMDAIRSLVDPLRGEFKLVGASARGERELRVVYTDGLRGSYGTSEAGLHWRKFGLRMTACQPFTSSRTDRLVEFATSGGAGPFLGTAGGVDMPWPRAISSSAVIGNNMRVQVTSEVPVYPTVELVGPMDSFTGTLEQAVMAEDGSYVRLGYYGDAPKWSVSVPGGIPAGSTLRLVTDPRAKSIRLGAGDPETTYNWTGELAAGRVARGSSFSPFYPGVNVLDVSAPGGTDATRVRIRWRELHRSIW